MRRSSLLAVFLIMGGLTAPTSQARETYSGRDLGINCADEQVCDAFFAGFLDAYTALLAWRPAELTPAFCITGTSVGREIWPFIAADLIARQDLAESTAASLVYLSLEKRHPCNDSQPVAVAQPVFMSGIDLSFACQNANHCVAFLVGVLDLHRTLVDRGELQTALVCIPEDAVNSELGLVVLNYLGAHPDQLTYSAGSLSLLALAETHGCQL